MTQRYTSPQSRERMAAGNCPECGNPPEAHGSDTRFWMPSVCGTGGLTRAGVEDRIQQYREDQEAKVDFQIGYAEARDHAESSLEES